ncbi:phage terminase small subunit P27 family [Jiella endophytica]|uniref:Phage terminase small subunit P27 family n=1 Tax=Jiella endophytica TaxID=2558362 RepID=A0A4Y8RU87_9HYPH|nr:phage terminase small subunit P27 family [Jiella endophytica]TFF27513.1 phage terminase small subunit P27 family [Jiella endophytica]
MKGRKPQLIIDNGGLHKPVQAPPDWMSKEAKAEWRRVMPLLVERRILTDADMASFENYCISIGRVRQLETLLAAGFDAPTFRAQDKAMATARLLAAELGLTPVSRSRPAMREDAADDDGDNPLDVS